MFEARVREAVRRRCAETLERTRSTLDATRPACLAGATAVLDEASAALNLASWTSDENDLVAQCTAILSGGNAHLAHRVDWVLGAFHAAAPVRGRADQMERVIALVVDGVARAVVNFAHLDLLEVERLLGLVHAHLDVGETLRAERARQAVAEGS